MGILFGFLSLAAAVALARGIFDAQTTAGRVTVAVIFGILLVVFITDWIVAIRRPARLEVTEDAIRVRAAQWPGVQLVAPVGR